MAKACEECKKLRQEVRELSSALKQESKKLGVVMTVIEAKKAFLDGRLTRIPKLWDDDQAVYDFCKEVLGAVEKV